jgi:indolepyruvate ferredoxin oxidoreductase
LLTKYQSANYAQTYRAFVEDIRKRVAAHNVAGGEKFVREVALSLGKLMYYKDEYEVARLFTDPKFMERLREQFAGDFKISFNLASDMLLPARDAAGHPKKRNLGPWILTAFKWLAPFKFLRGTPFDPIGYLPERKLERRLIIEYRDLINRIVDKLDQTNFETGVEIANAAIDIGGYGHVKEASVKRYETRLKSLLDTFDNPQGANVAPRELRVRQL